MKLDSIKALDERYVVKTYKKYDLALVEGKGCMVWDSTGKEYLDLFGGIAVNILGHAHPRLVHAISEQAGKMIHVTNLFYTQEQADLAQLLVNESPIKDGKVFFCNSGAEANEAGIKFARKYMQRVEIIAMKNSFHGRTMGSLAITDKIKYQKPFVPLMPEVKIVTYGNLEDLEQSISDRTAAVFLEVIQGEGGILLAGGDLEGTRKYLEGVREICDRKGILMVIDEVQTGMGRTGKFFSCQQFDVTPDIITMAKGIAGGVPMGATIISKKIADAIELGDHASTFGGNPLVCAASKAVIDTLNEEGLIKAAANKGAHLMDGLRKLGFVDVRGMGLMVGAELDSPERAEKVRLKLLDKGILINVAAGKVLRFTPPLIISEAEIDFALEKIKEVLEDV
jgi:acetylornithine/N-succinyldiaminopimelate aminotransferase